MTVYRTRSFLNRLCCVMAGVFALLPAPPAALAEFIPGRLYVSVVPAHGFPDQPNNAVFEFDPLTGQSRLFAEMPVAINGRISGLCFSPDGSTLYASLFQSSTIAAIKADGTVSTAYGVADGIVGPLGANNLDFDSQGRFYVANYPTGRILRFPANGGAAEVLVSDKDVEPLTVSPTGDVYYASEGSGGVRRLDINGAISTFDALPGGITSMTSDSANHLYVTSNTQTTHVWRYSSDDPNSRVLVTNSIFAESRQAIALSPDESTLYVTAGQRVYAVTLATGAASQIGLILTDYPSSKGDGLAVYVPEPTSLTLLVALAFGVAFVRSRR